MSAENPNRPVPPPPGSDRRPTPPPPPPMRVGAGGDTLDLNGVRTKASRENVTGHVWLIFSAAMFLFAGVMLAGLVLK